MTMADDVRAAQSKGRSASICAPGFSSMEAVLTGGVPGTPPPDTSRRRRPATRSQSARLTGGKSIRRRAAAANQEVGGSNQSIRSGSSEPRLHEAASVSVNDSPSPGGFRRKGSARRVNSVYQRKSQAFLDVPDSQNINQTEDEDSYRLRSFSFTSKGVVNRGDSFRRRRSRSNSLLPPGLGGDTQGDVTECPPAPLSPVPSPDVISYNVAMLGAAGVGKTALVSQFMTSECINAYDRQRDLSEELSVCIMLNGEESELKFINITNERGEIDKTIPADAFVVMYSVIDKASFQKAEDELGKLQDMDVLRSRPAIVVANKVDLVRSRAVSSQDGKCLACTYRAKFIEISVGINHNVDELLVGILNQIRLKRANADKESGSHWYKNRGVVRASMKARQMFTWIFGKEDTKFKNCENLHVL